MDLRGPRYGRLGFVTGEDCARSLVIAGAHVIGWSPNAESSQGRFS